VTRRAIQTALLLVALCGAELCWEFLIPALLLTFRPDWADSEMVLYTFDKLGFAVALALFLSAKGLWRRCGFAGGVPPQALGLLWPLWLLTGLAALQGVAVEDTTGLLGWLAIATGVGFGEEGLFRGLVIDIVGIDRPRRAAAVSAFLFGLLHLAGLLAPVDYRYVLAQAVAAGCLGLVLGAVRLLCGSIWPGIIAHAALDFFGLAAAGSISSAMEFSIGTLVVMLAGAALALGWGALLWQRLPDDG
jgi:membrane protease YdiL (CAAX protease family)